MGGRVKTSWGANESFLICVLALAAYAGTEAGQVHLTHLAPAKSTVGICLATASVIVMPLLGRAKRKVGLGLASCALVAEARQTEICAYRSATLLIGLG